MAAVNLLQLRKEINALMWHFTDPDAFEKTLRELFEKYRTSRNPTGAAILQTAQAAELSVPLIVLRELEIALFRTVADQPEAALKLSDRLMNSDTLEIRTIAARILGLAPISYSDAVFQRIENWARQSHETAELRVFIRSAGSLVRRTDAERLLDQARLWVAAGNAASQALGIEVLIYLVEFGEFQNLPAVFTLLETMLRSGSTTLQPELLDLTENLLERSPVETSFTIRLILESENRGTMTPRIARKILSKFSEPSRSAIRDLLRKEGVLIRRRRVVNEVPLLKNKD